jgi:hypothetical protein
VSRQLFEAAAKVRAFNEKAFVTRHEILEGMRVVLRREGQLTAAIVNAAPELPSANTVEARFGSLVQAYEELGYQPAAQYRHHATDRALKALQEKLVADLLAALPRVSRISGSGLLSLTDGRSAAVIVCRHQQPRSYKAGWRIAYQRTPAAHLLFAARMVPGNTEVRDILVMPTLAAAQLPLFLRERDDGRLAPWVHLSFASAAQELSRCA